jgi:hypothetical protein
MDVIIVFALSPMLSNTPGEARVSLGDLLLPGHQELPLIPDVGHKTLYFDVALQNLLPGTFDHEVGVHEEPGRRGRPFVLD